MAKPPLPRYRGIYRQKRVPRDEMILNDIVQSFEGRDLLPTDVGAGYCGGDGPCYACAATALAGYDNYVRGLSDAGLHVAAIESSWDDPTESYTSTSGDEGQASDAAHRALQPSRLGLFEAPEDEP